MTVSWDHRDPGRRTGQVFIVLGVLAVALIVVALAVGTAKAGRSESVAAIRLVFPAATENAAIRVARCETGGTFYARSVGRAGERGLFQIHPVHFGWLNEARLFEPVYNARIAYRLSRGGTSWRAWSCRP